MPIKPVSHFTQPARNMQRTKKSKGGTLMSTNQNYFQLQDFFDELPDPGYYPAALKVHASDEVTTETVCFRLCTLLMTSSLLTSLWSITSSWKEKYPDNPTDAQQRTAEMPERGVEKKEERSTWARLIKKSMALIRSSVLA